MVGHGEKECAEEKQAQWVVGRMVELLDAASAVVVKLRAFLLSCGKFTQLNLCFQEKYAETACFLPRFCSKCHHWTIFATVLLEIRMHVVSKRMTVRPYI